MNNDFWLHFVWGWVIGNWGWVIGNWLLAISF
jgi:hypothetical protein